jgi:magnesium chelatase family protein
MGIAKTHSVALEGTRGTVVEVEVNVTRGLSKTSIIGLRDTVLSECRDRVRAAAFNAGHRWPDGNVTIGLAPAWIRKEGSAFDLAVAVAALAADGQIDKDRLPGLVLLAEVCLDGRLRPVRGVLPSAVAGRASGLPRLIVAEPNHSEAAQIPNLEVYGMRSLGQVVAMLRGEEIPEAEPLELDADRFLDNATAEYRRPLVDLADVLGQYEARQALEVSAAGGHHMLLAGAPGAGKTLLAERLPTILPPLDEEQALEVSVVHSIAGTLSRSRPLITEPPYQSVHHTCTVAAMVGGGSGRVMPGVISRAHRGVLFIDEIAEVQRSVLEALREPLESGEVVIARASGSVRFPAKFLLTAAMNPCPCGSAGVAGGSCACTPDARRKYTSKLSGPLLDRIDLRIAVQPLGRAELFGSPAGESSAAVRERVQAARERSAARYAGTPWKTNAEVPGRYLRSTWAPDPEALVDAEKRFQSGSLTARGFDRLVRTAWTLADLGGRDRPGPDEVGIAMAFRQRLPGQLAS